MKQTGAAWANVLLGNSDRPCKHFGSTEICLTQAFGLAGRSFDPRTIIAALAQHNAYSVDGDDIGPGIVILEVLPSIWPYFHMGGTQFTLIQGRWGIFGSHTVLQLENKTVFDPYYGLHQLPRGFVPGAHTRTFHIDSP